MSEKPRYTLRILGHDIPVYEQKDLDREYNRAGHFDPKLMRIKIASGDAKGAQLSTVIHEVIEALDCILSLDLKHEEQLVKLEAGLFSVIQDNRKLIKRLL